MSESTQTHSLLSEELETGRTFEIQTGSFTDLALAVAALGKLDRKDTPPIIWDRVQRTRAKILDHIKEKLKYELHTNS